MTTFTEERLTGIGGSDAASLFNIGYGCRRRLWYEKTRTEPDYPREESDAMALGKALEPFFLVRYMQETGRRTGCDDFVAHDDIPYLIVHVDAYVYDDARVDAEGTRRTGVLEIKSCGRGAFYKYKREGLPEDYILQLQHAMLVTGFSWGSYGIGCRDTGELLHWDVEPNAEVQEAIKREAKLFWDSPSVAESPQPQRLFADDPRCHRCEYRTTCQGENLITIQQAGEYTVDESLSDLVRKRQEFAAIAREATGLLEDATEELKAAMGDRSMVMAAGHRIQFYTQHVAGYTVAARDQRPLRVYPPKKGKS
jgi:predicted phage-related endonuclease